MKRATTLLFVAILLFKWGVLNGEENKILSPEAIKAMSFDQLRSKAEISMKEMNEILKNGFEMVKDARSKQDFPRLNCLNEVVGTLKGLLKISEQNSTDLQNKVARKDKEGAEHEFVKITIASEKIREIDTQMKACGGPSAEGIFEVEPVVETDFDDDLPQEDTTVAIEEEFITKEIGNPSSESPYY